MATIHIKFNERDPNDAYLYEKLEALGKKNRSVLLKALATNAVEQYGDLFSPECVTALLALLQRGDPGIQQTAIKTPVPMTGKKRGRKPKSESQKPAPVKKSSAPKKPVETAKTEDEQITPVIETIEQPVKSGGDNKDFYERMGSFLEDEIYNT